MSKAPGYDDRADFGDAVRPHMLGEQSITRQSRLPHLPTKLSTGGFSIFLSTRNPPFPFEDNYNCLKSRPSFVNVD